MVVGVEREGAVREVHTVDVGLKEVRAEATRLLLELDHQLRALDAFGEAGVVLDLGGDGELSAGLRAVDDEGFEVSARGVDGGGQARRPRADDDDFAVQSLFRHAVYFPSP